MKELKLAAGVELREIKSKPLTEKEVDSLKEKSGTYESIFSKRARKYKELGLNEMNLQEKDYRKYLLTDYTFLKRPVLETADQAVAGNSKKQVEIMKTLT